MTFLSDNERANLAARSTQRIRRAEALVNPASGLANDYLNLFNEIIMLVEQLPTMPELYEEVERWRPVSYREYFRRSILPGRGSALDAYDRLDPTFRKQFEAVVEELDLRATGAVAAVRKQFKSPEDPRVLAMICERAGMSMRETLVKATMLVNHGKFVGREEMQARADQLMRVSAAF